MTSTEFDDWVYNYDKRDIQYGSLLIDKSEWDVCISSNLYRAVETAKALCGNEIIYTDQLREIRINSVFIKKVKLPHVIWLILGRVAWWISHASQVEGRQETIKRIRKYVDYIVEHEASNLLIVSHGALMWYLRKELRNRGFKGEIFIEPRNGKIYIFNRN
jgi:broad specificity phosphatase PhoE